MELRINQLAIPERPSFNYEELKTEIAKKSEVYASLVYTESEIKAAKADRSNLNKLKKALNDERIRREKEYMQPFNEFKAEVNEIISLIDKPILTIDSQIKGFEEQKKAEKLEQIKKYWTNTEIQLPIPLTFDQIFNEKWLNATVKMSAIETEIDAKLKQIETDLATLSKLPEFSFEAVEVYKDTLDMNKAISEGRNLADIQKRKQEAEKARSSAEPQHEPQRAWIGFKANMTVLDAKALKEFFESRHIEYHAI